MLGDFNFFHHLPQRRAITRSIFTNDPHLLGALGLSTLTHTHTQNMHFNFVKTALLYASETELRASGNFNANEITQNVSNG